MWGHLSCLLEVSLCISFNVVIFQKIRNVSVTTGMYDISFLFLPLLRFAKRDIKCLVVPFDKMAPCCL